MKANEKKPNLPNDPLGLNADNLSNIKNVWKYNHDKEFARMSKAIEEGFNYAAMDTEFPGILFNSMMDNKDPEMGYHILKMNVDSLKLIQVGISLCNEKGEKPKGIHTWQFNLNFNINTEKFNAESISLLREAGISFEQLIEHGIDPMTFGDMLMTSGLVVNPDIYWVAFHGAYDFTYLLKVLINDVLPQTSEQFLQYLKHLFPNIYDIKTIINDFDEWKNLSLSRLGNDLMVKRTGHQHQAGSDALLTMEVFFAISKNRFAEGIPVKFFNKVFGISNDGNFNSSKYPQEMMMPHFYNYSQFYPHFSYYNDPLYVNQMNNYYYPAQPMTDQFNMSMRNPNAQAPIIHNPYQRN